MSRAHRMPTGMRPLSMLKGRLQSFRHAFAGARILLRTQPNARLHLAATVAVIAAAFAFEVTKAEWGALVAASALVWLCEAFNTAIEFLADEVTLERRPRIKHAKDVAAFAVLVSALAAVVVGTLVFLPRLLALG